MDTTAGIKERLKQFIETQKISIREFERTCDLGNSFVNNIGKTIGADKLEKILQSFPTLNKDWLLYGSGEMLSGNVYQSNQNGDNINGHNVSINSESSRLLSLLEAKDVQIAEKDKQIDRLLKMIESLNN